MLVYKIEIVKKGLYYAKNTFCNSTLLCDILTRITLSVFQFSFGAVVPIFNKPLQNVVWEFLNSWICTRTYSTYLHRIQQYKTYYLYQYAVSRDTIFSHRCIISDDMKKYGTHDNRSARARNSKQFLRNLNAVGVVERPSPTGHHVGSHNETFYLKNKYFFHCRF